jgi:hypothetical protein
MRRLSLLLNQSSSFIFINLSNPNYNKPPVLKYAFKPKGFLCGPPGHLLMRKLIELCNKLPSGAAF